jgi:hypothetical protein
MYGLTWVVGWSLVVIGGCGVSLNGGAVVDVRGQWAQIIIASEEPTLDTSVGGYVLLADFDSDGKVDAASGFVSSQAAVVHMQNVPGSWTSTVVGTGLGAVNSLAVADIDDSGQPDIVAATGSGNVWLLFAPPFSGPAPANWKRQALSNPVTVGAWNDVKIANFDDFSALDIVATSVDRRVIVLWRSESLVSSSASYRPSVIAADLRGGFERLAVADVDDDGDLDLVACGPLGGVIWLENQGGVNAILPWILHEISPALGPTRLVAADLDDDDDIDVAVTERDSGQVVWYESLGFPRADPWPVHLMADLSPGRPDAIGFGDLDDDGDVDILVGTDVVQQSIFWLDRLSNARLPWQIRLVDQPGFDVGELPTGDIDDLGLTDFATTLAGSNTPVVWYKNE